MLIIHLSDIHFRIAEVTSNFDPNIGLRADILLDITERLSHRGEAPVAIIVSGDIAFAGKAEEYQYARGWFEELCEVCGVGYERLFLVPGNHDVDRSAACALVVEALHDSIGKVQEAGDVRKRLVQLLEDDTAGLALHSPIRAYNDFASGLDCSFSAPANTTVKRELMFPDGSSLNIWGFNSSLFCGGKLDRKGDLLIDPAFPNMRNAPGVVNLAVFHHPVSWLRHDGEFKTHLDQHANIHLFGHEHAHAIDIGSSCVRMSASALHPEHGSGDYEPGYNLISLEISDLEGLRELRISIEAREYQKRPNKFREKVNEEGKNYSAIFPLPPWKSKLPPRANVPVVMEPEMELTAVDPTINFRVLALEFLSLPMSSRYRIAEELSLISLEDNDQPDFERCKRMLLRAKERDQLSDLADSIKQFRTAN